MKKIILNTLLVSTLFVFVGCERLTTCMDCAMVTFEETYLRKFQDKDVFLIKGVALDVYKHGRKIKVIEDIKGNFTGKSSIFVWGESDISSCDNKDRQDLRVDDITKFKKNDTLIMFITKTRKRFWGDIEKSGDYATLNGCYLSVLELSDGYVVRYRYVSKSDDYATLRDSIKFPDGYAMNSEFVPKLDNIATLGERLISVFEQPAGYEGYQIKYKFILWEELQEHFQNLLKNKKEE